MAGSLIEERGVITLIAGSDILKGQSIAVNAEGKAIPAPAGTIIEGVVGIAMNNASTNDEVTVITLRGAVVYALLDSANVAISIGDSLSVDGTVPGVLDKASTGGFALALEAKAANSGGLIKCLIV